MTAKRYLFSVANNGHEDKSWTRVSGETKRNAAHVWGAEYVLHTDIRAFVPAPSTQNAAFYEKFEMFRHCDGDIMFTDSDVVLTAHCPNPFESLAHDRFHAVWESEYLVRSRFYEELWPVRGAIYDLLEDGWPREQGTACPRFFNSGVMYFPKAVRDLFLDRIEEIRAIILDLNARQAGGFADQEIFNFLVRHYRRLGLLKVDNLPANWNVQVSLEWRNLRGAYPWERFRRYRYWRNQAYWAPNARLGTKAYCIHYTGASREALEPEYQSTIAPDWATRLEEHGQ